MWNAGLDEAQAGIKFAMRNTNNLRYADDITLMAESEEELKSFLMKVRVESEKAGLKLNIQKTRITASGPITPWQMDGKTMETVTDFIFLSSKITVLCVLWLFPFDKWENRVSVRLSKVTQLVMLWSKLQTRASPTLLIKH